MKFSQIEGLVFFWPVTVRTPDLERAGAVVEETFDAQFLQLPKETLASFGTDDDGILRAAIQGWRKIEDADEKPVPFSEAGRDRLISNTFAKPALMRAYFEGMSGARVKN